MAPKELRMPQDEVKMNEDDVKALNEAKERNKGTTARAKEALKVARETEKIAEETLCKIDGQTNQIKQLDDKLVEMKENVKKSESYLKYISRYCVCFNCLVTDPIKNEEKKWKNEVEILHKKDEEGDNKTKKEKTGTKATGKVRRKSSEKLPNVLEMVPVKVVEGSDMREIKDEYVVQDNAVQEISTVLTNLKTMGETMGEELDKQNKLLNDLDNKAAPLKDRMRDMNNRTRLSKIHVKKKSSATSDIIQTSTNVINSTL